MLQVFSDLRTLVLFLVTLTLIIAVHEFGHYITARLLGMRVLEFAFGFPPRAFAWVHAGIAYSLNWIPFGGFVRILGQDDFAIRQEGEGEPGSFTSKPWWSQAIVLVAGVAMNIVLALVVLTAAFSLGTTAPTGEVKISEVKPGSPAQAAGIKAGDIVRTADGQVVRSPTTLVRLTYRSACLNADGSPIEPSRCRSKAIVLELERAGLALPAITAQPRSEPPRGEGPLGIVLEEVTAPVAVPLPEAVAAAVALTGDVLTAIAELPGQLTGGGPSGAPQVGGPIEIFRVTGQVAEFGVPTFLKLIGVLSINLAVFNILPFPGLDGGRLFFVLLGGIFRIRLSPQIEAAVHAVGFVLLLALIVLVSIADIRRVVGG